MGLAILVALAAAAGLFVVLQRSFDRPGPLPAGPPGGVPLALSLGFFLSGVAALVYQVVWQRLLVLHSGVGIYSVALIVSAFMAGLGLGSWLGGRLSLRLDERRALLAFAALELGLAGLGAASSWLYYDLVRGLPPPASLWEAGLVHCLALLPPTTLMGMSLPFLARAVVLDSRTGGRRLGALYALNVLGAALGAALAPWVLMRLYGLRGATWAAAAANLAAALLALLALRRRGAPGPAAGEGETPATVTTPASAWRPGAWVPLYALSGFCALALEILWFRLFDVAARGTAFSFGTVLAAYLAGTALGGLAGARLTPRLRAPRVAFLAVQALILLYAGLGPLLAAWLPADTPGFRALVDYWRGGEVFLLGRSLQAGPLLLLYGLLPVALYGPATFLMGLSFPILQRAVQDEARTSGLKTGLLQAANIAGCVAGSLLAGLAGLQWLGTADTLRALLVLGCAFPLLGLRDGGSRAPFALAAASLLSLALALPSGQDLWARLHGVAQPEQALVAEDASGVVLLSPAESGRWKVWTNGHHHSSLPFGGVHTLLGALPALLHPGPERVAIVGLGSGDTAWAASLHPATRELDVFEICGAQRPLLAQLAARAPLPDLTRLLGDPRLRLQVVDGRQALARSPGRYDLLELDPLWPYYAYSGNLYSREFFELAAASLRPGGIACTWSPTPRVRATFMRVFRHVRSTARGHVLLGSATPLPTATTLEPALQAAALAHLGPERLAEVLAELSGMEAVAGKPTMRANLDLHPRDELSLGDPPRARRD